MALAFFDLDGTLTRFDTFLPYCLLALLLRPWRIFFLKPVIRRIIWFSKGLYSRHDLKESFVTAFLAGYRKEEIGRLNRIFLRIFFPFMVRESIAKIITRHRQRGDSVYIVSASPDVYVHVIAKRLNAAGVLCTRLEFRGGVLTGAIFGKNCRGSEKEERIRAIFTETDLKGSFAYGDSPGDREMIDLASFGFWV